MDVFRPEKGGFILLAVRDHRKIFKQVVTKPCFPFQKLGGVTETRSRKVWLETHQCAR